MRRNASMILFGLTRWQSAILLAFLVTVIGLLISSTPSKEKFAVSGEYDVFLSFRGEDTRTGFTDFLYNSLDAMGVRVFKDVDHLPMGEEIFGELMQAIRKSKISIPIISQDYAGREYCLLELVEMLTCRKIGGQLIFPIFYKVSSDDVLELEGEVGRAFRSLKSKVDEKNMHKIKAWEEALRLVAKIKGWESRKIANGHEGVLVNMVVAKVLSELNTTSHNFVQPSNFISPPITAAHHLVSKRSDGTESQYEVFLNFYEEDTRAGFTDYLYISLINAGVRVFSVDNSSLIGKDFAEEISTAIKNSKIFIPIISQNYAKSVSCLRELTQMMDCKKRKRQKIMPIFYKVKPSHVREVTYEFGGALTQHRLNLFDKRSLFKWEQALKAIGVCRGLESEKIADGHEGKLVKLVVKGVLSELSKTQPSSNKSSSWLLRLSDHRSARLSGLSNRSSSWLSHTQWETWRPKEKAMDFFTSSIILIIMLFIFLFLFLFLLSILFRPSIFTASRPHPRPLV